MADILYDSLVIGSGPAGLTASLYTARSGLQTLVLEKTEVGGNTARIDHLVNYPGFVTSQDGAELTRVMQEQAVKFGADFANERAQNIIKENDKITVFCSSGNFFQSKTLLIASGKSPKRPPISGEERFIGHGVSYCATCDGAFFRGKIVVVAGVDDTALEEALFLAQMAEKVYLVAAAKEGALNINTEVLGKVKSTSNISWIWQRHVVKIEGDDNVKEIILDNEQRIATDGVFFIQDSDAASALYASVVKTDDKGYIITDENMATSVENIFAAGDVRSKNLRQVITAAADGAIAADSIRKYLQHK